MLTIPAVGRVMMTLLTATESVGHVRKPLTMRQFPFAYGFLRRNRSTGPATILKELAKQICRRWQTILDNVTTLRVTDPEKLLLYKLNHESPPAAVRKAALIIDFIAIYCACIGAIAIPIGVLSGLHLILGGATHVLLAVALLVARVGLLKRCRFSYWLTMTIAAMLILLSVLGIAGIVFGGSGGLDNAAIVFPLFLAFLFIYIIFLLQAKSARDWVFG